MPLLHEYHLDHVLFPHLAAGRQRYMAYSKSQSVERMKNPDVDRKDFFYYLLKAKDPETGASFALPELWAESNLLIIAGSDTTSTALAAAFFYLVHNPATLQIAQDEIRNAFSDEEEIVAGATLNSCTYLRAVLDESMRLSAPVGGILPREVIGKGLDIDGHHFPAGVDVGTSHYAVHHNPAYYPAPFSFKPERWIVAGETTQEDVTKAKSAFCAFSVGPRACIGRALAYTELMISLGRVLYTFDMRLAGGPRVGEGGVGMGAGRERQSEYQLKDSFTSLKDGPMVEFRRR
jgi:cytochrome P450